MEKSKRLLTIAKAFEAEGEHRITFVASSANIDRDGEIVEIGTFKLPLKGGGYAIVKDLPAEGIDNADIPLLVDHNIWEVEKTIGSVRNAKYVNGELVFEAGISKRQSAEELFQLVEEGHLDNAFSIQWHGGSKSDDANGVRHYSEGEIIEVSLVSRGANQDARVLAAKGLAEGNEAETSAENTEDTEADTANASGTDGEQKSETDESDETAENTEQEDGVQETESEEKTEVNDTTTNDADEAGDNTMDGETVKALATEKASQAQVVAVKTSADSYLASKAAMHDFAKMIADNRGMRSEQIMKMWSDNVQAKGITGDAILPTSLEQIFFKSWTDDNGVLSTFRTINTNSGSLNAFTGDGEDIRAKGHKKGQTKADQNVTNIRRDIKSLVVYKKLPIDLQDLLDDQTGEILRFRAEELAGRVYREIAVGAILGDGRTAPTGNNPDWRVFDGTRGLFSMVNDITNSKTANSYASIVARTVDASTADNEYDKAIKALAQVKDEGRGKILIVPTGWEATIRLAKDNNGAYLFQPGADVRNILGVARFYEFDEMVGSGYDVIAYANGSYGLFGTGAMTRTDFDINNNTDVMLFEKPAAGSLYGSRAAAGYKSADES